MEDKSYPSLGDWTCLKTIGYGSHSKVKLAKHSKTEEQVAIKILKLSDTAIDFKRLKEEVEMMRKIDHPNVIKLKEFHENLEYKKRNGKSVPVAAIVMELATGGELFEYVKRTGKFTEEEARTIFHVLIETLQFFHTKGIVHRNIKPENLLFDADFNLKIADLGYSTTVISSEGYQQLTTIPTSDTYLAPEVLLGQPYDGMVLDLFSAAMILFVMVTGLPPFMRADSKDPFYKLILICRYDNFWAAHQRGQAKEANKKSPFSDEFKAFMNSMFSADPAQRLTLSEIKSHPWYTGKTETLSQIKKNFELKQLQVEEALKKLREEKAKDKERRKLKEKGEAQFMDLRAFNGVRVWRGLSDRDITSQYGGLNEMDLEKPRELYPFDTQICKPLSRIMTTIEPQVLFKQLAIIADGILNKPILCETHYKISGRIFSDDGTCDIKILIMAIDETTNCVEFQRKKGSATMFYRLLEEKFIPSLDKLMLLE